MQNVRFYTAEVRKYFDQLIAVLEPSLQKLEKRDAQMFKLRFERYFSHLFDGLKPIYGRRSDFDAFLERLALRMLERFAERPESLKVLDMERDLTPDWFQREDIIGYVFYVERFAKTLKGVEKYTDYLEEIGANYLHLMYCLKPREGENDGGYAIADYRAVDPKLGAIDDLELLCSHLRERGISVCIDLVLNHCADSHEWAAKAREGDGHYQQFFYMYPNRSVPDEFEQTLPEVFPDFAPGNFSYDKACQKWVWTTFNDYQWDLNWTNPEVFLEVIDILFFLANKGVEIFRLDAVAFMWKRMGTNCQNQPEVHDLLQAIRACSKITVPACAHKAEAIVSPQDLIHYFGTGKRYGKVSNIAYHNSLMVQFWSALASRDTTLMSHTLASFPRTPSSIAWGTYIRCHDDIGWAITDEEAASIGINAYLHRSFLSDFYAGDFEGSHARGAVFQYNPQNNDKRISGSFASLVGLEKAVEEQDERLIALSVERILLGFALICGYGGIPLIYMGDEIGMLNDYSYSKNPDTASDNRWMHRPYMDWGKAKRRQQVGSIEYRIFEGLRKIIRARKRLPHLHSYYESVILDKVHPQLFVHRRKHPLGTLLSVYNFSEKHQRLDTALLFENQLEQPYDQLEQRFLDTSDGSVSLAPYARLWII